MENVMDKIWDRIYPITPTLRECYRKAMRDYSEEQNIQLGEQILHLEAEIKSKDDFIEDLKQKIDQRVASLTQENVLLRHEIYTLGQENEELKLLSKVDPEMIIEYQEDEIEKLRRENEALKKEVKALKIKIDPSLDPDYDCVKAGRAHHTDLVSPNCTYCGKPLKSTN